MPDLGQKTAIQPVEAPLHLCAASTFALCKMCPQYVVKSHFIQTVFLREINARLGKPFSTIPAWWIGWTLKGVIDKMMVNTKMALFWRYKTITQENYTKAFCARLDNSSSSTVVNNYVASQADTTPDILKYCCWSSWLPREFQLEPVGTTRTEYTAVGKSPTGNSTHRHLKELWVLHM